jgi:hypothetical protein
LNVVVFSPKKNGDCRLPGDGRDPWEEKELEGGIFESLIEINKIDPIIKIKKEGNFLWKTH